MKVRKKVKQKKCFRCGEVKPLVKFYRHPRMKDGRLNKCKECTKRDVKGHRKDNPEKLREYERKRQQTDKRKRQMREHTLRYRAKNPDKYKAHNAVNNAIRDGKLTREPCWLCGFEKSEAHHDDYSKPLEVCWLCFDCHRKAHS